jgi:signal transduction histidine kinase
MGEARGSERRHGAAVLALPRAWGTGALRAMLRQAVRAVETAWPTATRDILSPGELTELLSGIERTLLAGDQADDRLRSNLGRRLLELVRAELVSRAADADDSLRAGGLWQLMEALEELRSNLEPHWHEQLASRLAGPDGLELVVEVVHDLRSPLSSVLFLAEVLAQGQSGPVNSLQRRQLGLMYSAAFGITELAGNIIELARGGNRLTDGEPAPFSMTDLLMSVSDIVRPMAEEKAIEIRVTPPNVDHRLGHTVALSRVLLNLTTNALKFTREGYVEVSARDVSVSRVELSVRDTGPGIRQQVESLYSAFSRAPTGQGYILSGTGLGLSLCRKLVGVMGGTLQVETRENWGTRFYFELELPPINPR